MVPGTSGFFLFSSSLCFILNSSHIYFVFFFSSLWLQKYSPATLVSDLWAAYVFFVYGFCFFLFCGPHIFDYMIAIACKGIKEIAAIYKILISLMCGLSQPYLYKFSIPYLQCWGPGISFFL